MVGHPPVIVCGSSVAPCGRSNESAPGRWHSRNRHPQTGSRIHAGDDEIARLAKTMNPCSVVSTTQRRPTAFVVDASHDFTHTAHAYGAAVDRSRPRASRGADTKRDHGQRPRRGVRAATTRDDLLLLARADAASRRSASHRPGRESCWTRPHCCRESSGGSTPTRCGPTVGGR